MEHEIGYFSEIDIYRDIHSGTDHLAIPRDETEMTLCGTPISSLTLVPPPKEAEALCGECDYEMQRIEAGDIHEPEVN